MREMKNWLVKQKRLIRVTFLSLFYNHHLSSDYVLDTVYGPLFYFVDNFSKIIGPIFVVGVLILNAAVIGKLKKSAVAGKD